MVYDLEDTEQHLDEDDTLNEANTALLKALNQLKPSDKTLIMDFYSGDLSMKEIAKKYNLGSEQAARNKKCRIIKRLRKKILH